MTNMQNSSTEPAVAVVRRVEDVNELPEGSLVIWVDSLNEERQAAVVREYDGQRSMEHTKSGSYWVDGIHMIEYPALALTWPTTDPVGDRAKHVHSQIPASPDALVVERTGLNPEKPVLDEISQLVDEPLSAGEQRDVED